MTPAHTAGRGALRRLLACLLLAALAVSASGCTNWEETDDPLGELSQFYSKENEAPEPEPLTTFTLPYFANESLDPITAGETVQAEPEAPPKYEAPEYASSAVNELFQQLLDAGCPTNSAEQVGAWPDAHPDCTDTVQGTSREYASMENGVERGAS